MRYRAINGKLVREDTTMGDVAYLPSGFTSVRNSVRSLARKKKEWNIELLEDENGTKVLFEDELSIYVPRECWEDFCMMFDEPLHGGHVNLHRHLKEAMGAELSNQREELKPALTKLFDSKRFRVVERSANNWRSRFGSSQSQTPDSVITVENKTRGIQKLVGELYKHYGNDLGNLDLLLEAIYKQKPLNSFKVFSTYDFLYGTRIYSSYEGIEMIYEGTLDMSYMLSESIAINDEEVLDELQDYGDVKIVRNIIYPTGDSFSYEFFGYLSEIIEGQTSSGDLE